MALIIMFTILAVTLAATASIADAAERPKGLTASGQQAILRQLNADAASGSLPGAVVLLAQNGEIVLHEAIERSGTSNRIAMTRDTLFQLYSMIKPIVSTAAMILLERGKLKLNDPVHTFIPALRSMEVLDEAGKSTPAKRPILVEDLLLHTAGMTYGFFGKGKARRAYQRAGFRHSLSLEDLVDRIAKQPLEHQPGEVWEYSRSIDVLGRVIEVASGQPLDEFLHKEIFEPLGMRDTGFGSADGRGLKLVGSAYVAEKPKVPGGGNLLSSAYDYFRFGQAILNGGILEGNRILKAETVALMLTDHLSRRGIVPGKYYLPGKGYGFGYGFAIRLVGPEPAKSWAPGHIGNAFWGGYGGTHFWIDRINRLIEVYMMHNPSRRRHYRRAMRDLVYGGR